MKGTLKAPRSAHHLRNGISIAFRLALPGFQRLAKARQPLHYILSYFTLQFKQEAGPSRLVNHLKMPANTI